jgi:uridine kinase
MEGRREWIVRGIPETHPTDEEATSTFAKASTFAEITADRRADRTADRTADGEGRQVALRFDNTTKRLLRHHKQL